MHADVHVDAEHPHKKMKVSNGWYTMLALENLLGRNTAKSTTNMAKRFDAQGNAQFLLTDGEDAFKVYFEQFYAPPPHGYPGRRREPY